jgi:hypothetical protein
MGISYRVVFIAYSLTLPTLARAVDTNLIFQARFCDERFSEKWFQGVIP